VKAIREAPKRVCKPNLAALAHQKAAAGELDKAIIDYLPPVCSVKDPTITIDLGWRFQERGGQ